MIVLGAVVVAFVGGLDSAHAEGPGIRAGDLVIHPRFAAGMSYDNNFFYDSERDSGGQETLNAATEIDAAAGVKVANRSPNKFALSADAGLAFRHVPSIGDEGSVPVSDGVRTARNGIASAGGTLRGELLPRSVVSLALAEELAFTDRPAFDTATVGFERFENAVGADLRFRPGPNPDSRALEMRLGYRYRSVFFLDAAAINAEPFEKNAHEGRFLTQWRFFPKTAALLDVRLAAVDYATESPVVGAGSATARDRDATPFRAELGLRGLLTNRVSVVLKGGFLNTFQAQGESFSGVVGKAEVSYVVEPTVRAGLGYSHDARDSGFSNFYVVDALSAHVTLFFLQGLSLEGRVAYELYDYSKENAPQDADRGGASVKRDDALLRAGATFGYRFRDWLHAELSWSLEKDSTDYVTPRSADLAVNSYVKDFAEYSRQVVALQISGEY